MNIDLFLTRYPEFGDTDADLVQATLDEASLELDLSACGWGPFSLPGQPQTIADTAHGMLTAHKLALSPMGQNARFLQNGGNGHSTLYYEHFMELVRKTIPGASTS